MYFKSFQITKTFSAATLKPNSSGFDGFLGSGHMKQKEGHIVTPKYGTTDHGTCGQRIRNLRDHTKILKFHVFQNYESQGAL